MGIFLLVVTVVLELAGAAWSYYYGSHVSAGLAGLLNDALGMFPGLQRYHLHVTTVFIGWAWVALYSLIDLATASPACGLGPVSRLTWPRSFGNLPGYDLT